MSRQQDTLPTEAEIQRWRREHSLCRCGAARPPHCAWCDQPYPCPTQRLIAAVLALQVARKDAR